MRRLEVDEAEIVRLYVVEGLRAQAIAERFGITVALVYARLDSSGVARSRVARMPIEEVIRLYFREH